MRELLASFFTRGSEALNSSQQSIQKVVGYALKYFAKCGEDLWDCIVEESEKVRRYRPTWNEH